MSTFDSGDGNLIVGAAGATVSDFFSCTVRVVTTGAATLQATFKLQGTDFGTKSGSEVTLSNFTLASVLPSGVTYSAGVITYNNPAIATHEVVLTALGCPRFVRGVWTFTSIAGGSVTADAALSSW